MHDQHAARRRTQALSRGARLSWALAAALLALWAAPAASQAPDPAAQRMASDAAAQTPPQPGAASNPPPLETRLFFGPPAYQRLALSPSGRWLAMSTAVGASRVRLVVFDLQQMKPLATAARFDEADVGELAWVNDESLVFDIADRQSGSGEQRWWPGLFSVGRDGKDLRRLVEVSHSLYAGQRSGGREPLKANHRLLQVPGNNGTEVVVGEWTWSGAGEFAGIIAKKLDVSTGRSSSLSLGAPDHVQGWLFDAQGEPRLVSTAQGGRGAYHWREPGTDSWRLLVSFGALQPPWRPRHLDGEGQLYVTVASGKDGVSQLHRFDFKRGEPEVQALVSTPGFDFQGTIVSESAASKALGVRTVTDAETTVWFDPAMKALQSAADQRLPGRINRIDCRRCGQPDMVALVQSWSDHHPGQAWLYQHSSQRWQLVANRRPDIDPRRMAATELHRVRMRDGLEIPVWVTTPPGPASTLRSAVVLVHGGPWVRGRSWNWSADAQFLASRGHVVIEPEFRGSTGYGQRLFRAGWKQWGTAMQDDLVDALAGTSALAGIDPQRVCVAGASYGGYATMMSLVRHPETYRCGVAWVAVTDPGLLYKWSDVSDLSDEWREHSLPSLIGDPVTDAALIAAATPVLQAAKIKAPVLLAMGGQDRRVPLEHGTRMRDALTTAGNPPEWLVYDDEAHGFFLAKNRIHFMNRVEAFLARHLKKP